MIPSSATPVLDVEDNASKRYVRARIPTLAGLAAIEATTIGAA